MIRSMEFVCSRCGEKYVPRDRLYYQDDYSGTGIRDAKLICDKCIHDWEEHWQIAKAEFHEVDWVLTVDITLTDGTEYWGLDCSAIPETETVVTGEDIPEKAQHRLYEIYAVWAESRRPKAEPRPVLTTEECPYDEAEMLQQEIVMPKPRPKNKPVNKKAWQAEFRSWPG